MLCPIEATMTTTKKRTKKEPTLTWFVNMEKDGKVIGVIPAQVEQHERLGWKKQ